jgi:hypothetical protein
MSKKEAKWNEFKGKLGKLLNVVPVPTFTHETIYHHPLVAYVLLGISSFQDG